MLRHSLSNLDLIFSSPSLAMFSKVFLKNVVASFAVLAAAAGAQSDSYNGAAAGATGAVVAGAVGAEMLSRSFKTSEEAKVHRDALNELGQSLDMELAPQVIEFEKETVKLTGDAKEQFHQWREFLKKIYAQEATPDVKL